MKYSKKDIDNALQLLKLSLTEMQDKELIHAVQVATDCMEVVQADKWIDAQTSLPEKQGYGNMVKCNVILVHSQTEWSFTEAPQTWEKEIVYSALFDTEQKIWHIPEECLHLNALIDPDNLPADCDYVSFWMYLPSIE